MADEEKVTTTEQTNTDMTQKTDEELAKIVQGKEVDTAPKTDTAKEKPPETSEKKDEKPPEVKPPAEPDELEKVKKQLADSQRYIQQRNQEIGELRKAFKQKISPEERKEKFFTDPDAATRDVVQEVEEERDQKINERRLLFNSMIPDFDELKDDIAKTVLELGHETAEIVEKFKANPYLATPEKVALYAEKVRAKRKHESLEKENADLKKKLETAQQDVLKNIEKASKETKGLTGKSGAESSGGTGEITEAALRSMSDAELDEFNKSFK